MLATKVLCTQLSKLKAPATPPFLGGGGGGGGVVFHVKLLNPRAGSPLSLPPSPSHFLHFYPSPPRFVVTGKNWDLSGYYGVSRLGSRRQGTNHNHSKCSGRARAHAHTRARARTHACKLRTHIHARIHSHARAHTHTHTHTHTRMLNARVVCCVMRHIYI